MSGCHCHARGERGTGKTDNRTPSDTHSVAVPMQQSAVKPILSSGSFRYALIQPSIAEIKTALPLPKPSIRQENPSDAESRLQGVHLPGDFRNKRHAVIGGAEQGGHRAGRCAQAAGRRRMGRLRPLAGDAGIHHWKQQRRLRPVAANARSAQRGSPAQDVHRRENAGRKHREPPDGAATAGPLRPGGGIPGGADQRVALAALPVVARRRPDGKSLL